MPAAQPAAAARTVVPGSLRRAPRRHVHAHRHVPAAARGRLHSLRYIALWCTEPWAWNLWPLLDEAIRSGGNVFEDVHGRELFDHLGENAPESGHMVNRAMTTSARSRRGTSPRFDLGDVSSVVDIGGGQGHVLAGLLEKYPDLHGTLLGLPGVVENADPRLWEGGAPAGPGSAPGTAARTVPVRADLSLIMNVLEREDDSTRRVLADIRAARSTRRRHGETRRRHPDDAVHHGHGPAAPQRWRRRAHPEEHDRPAGRRGPGHRRGPAGRRLPARLRAHRPG
ncbi:hypothetical protein GCM10027162_69670 [Streptomyces incanus]